MTYDGTERGSFLPPIVLIPHAEDDDRLPMAGRAPAAAANAARAAICLEAVDPYAGRQALSDSLGTVVDQLQALAQCLPDADGVPVPSGPPIHEYFRVRTAPLDPLVAAANAIQAMTAALEDLPDVALGASDIERLLTAMRQILLGIAGDTPAASEVTSERARAQPARDHERRWISRWIIAHQLHALLNVHATVAVRSATRAGVQDGPGAAVEQLRTAMTLVSAFAPCRAYALTIPSRFYLDVLRPTMAPPFTTVPLSGRMHPEYRAFRAAIDELLTLLPGGIVEMAATAPRFVFARESLLVADLIDAERHVTLVEPIVGQSKALGQPDRVQANALGALRKIRDARTRQFRPFMRHGADDEPTA